jgi:hypothetical protein
MIGSLFQPKASSRSRRLPSATGRRHPSAADRCGGFARKDPLAERPRDDLGALITAAERPWVHDSREGQATCRGVIQLGWLAARILLGSAPTTPHDLGRPIRRRHIDHGSGVVGPPEHGRRGPLPLGGPDSRWRDGRREWRRDPARRSRRRDAPRGGHARSDAYVARSHHDRARRSRRSEGQADRDQEPTRNGSTSGTSRPAMLFTPPPEPSQPVRIWFGRMDHARSSCTRTGGSPSTRSR